ncbi:MAG: Ig-like domain-containing protein, partial [Pseudomonadota bacterium]
MPSNNPAHSAPTNPGGRAVHVAVHASAVNAKFSTDPALKALMAKGYVPARQLTGKVVGVWGEAMLRDADGQIRPLQVGDVVKKGQVVLTGQDGIVQIEPAREPRQDKPSDIEKVIADVEQGTPEAAPAAGIQGGGEGDIQPGLRVDRINETVTPATIGTEPYTAPTRSTRSADTAPAEELADSAKPDAVTVAEDGSTSFDPRTNDSFTGGGAPAIETVGGQPIAVGTPVQLPQGTVTLNPDGTLTFTPEPDFNGSVTIPYTGTDDSGDPVGSTIVVTVTPVNDLPVAAPDIATVAEDSTLVIDPRSNDSDPDGDPLAVTEVDGQPISVGAPVTLTGDDGQPVGTVGLQPDGSLVFVPAPNYNGPVDFDYTVDDGQGGTDTSSVSITVTPVNDSPVVVDDNATTPEDTPVVIDVLANDSDGDGDPLAITEVDGQPIAEGTPVTLANGSGQVALNPDGTLTFTPTPGFNGPVDFGYAATDGTSPVQGSVHVEVNPVNDAPVAGDDRATVAEDTPTTLDLLGNDSDADGDALVISHIGGQPVTPGTPVALTDAAGQPVGSVTINLDGTVTFTPAPGYNGPVDFEYTVTDGQGGSDTASVSLDVGGVNDTPVAAPDTGSTSEDVALVVDTAHGVIQGGSGPDTDPDGDTLIVSGVAFGATTGAVGLPIDGAWGRLTLNADGSYSYVPNAAAQALDDGESRTDVFTYTVTDPAGATAVTTLTLTVNGRNDAPVAVDDSATLAQDTPITLDLRGNDSDADGDPLAVTAIDGQAISVGSPVTLADGSGDVTLNADGTVTFTPAPGFNGTVDFDYTVSDGSASDTGHVHLVVDDVNDAPLARNDSVTGVEDSVVTFDPRGNDSDPDGDALAITHINGQPIAVGTPIALPEGQLSLNADGTLSFQPAPDYTGTLSLDYQVSDGRGGTANATVDITINPLDDASVLVADTATTAEDTPVSGNVLANDSDVDNALTVATFTVNGVTGTFNAGQTVTIVGVGTLLLTANGTYTFTPASNWNGTVPQVTYTTNTGSTSTLGIAVTPADDASVLVGDTATTTEDTPVSGNVLTNDADVDNALTVSTFTVNGVTGTFNAGQAAVIAGVGSLTLNADGSYTFTPAANWNGAVPTVTYTTNTGSTSTLGITVTPVDDTSVLVADTATTAEDTPVSGNVLANDADVDNALTVATFTVNGVTGTFNAGQTVVIASVGSVTIAANGNYTFTPASNWNGAVPQVTYTTNTGSSSTLGITVTPVDDTSVLVADTATTTEDTPVSGNVLANDSDIDNTLTVATFTVNGVTGTFNAGQAAVIAGVGSLTLNADGSYTFTPAAN